METAKSTVNKKTATVLLVEDNGMNQMLLEIMLNRLQYKVLFACNGNEALEVLRKTPVDLVLSDVNMPFMDGFTLLDKIRAQYGCEQVPVVLMTAGGRTSLSAEALKKGADGFLIHPFSSYELQQTLDRFMPSQKIIELIREI